MPYFPGIPPENIDDFRRWLADELNRINPNIQEGQSFLGFEVHYDTPTKYEIGHIAYASGTAGSPGYGWNPGAGEGLYEYSNLGWQKLGGGDGGVVPTSHSVLQDLSADDHTQYHTNARGDVRYYTKAYIDAMTLNGLANVDMSGVSDGDLVTWDSGTSKWINEPPVSLVNELDDLNDVTLTTPATWDVMAYNGVTSQWENEPFPVSVLGTNQFEGGIAITVYLIQQNMDGGGSNETYFTSDTADGGTA